WAQNRKSSSSAVALLEWDPGMEADHSLPRHSAGSTVVVGVRARCHENFRCFLPSVCDSRLFLASQNGNTKTKTFFPVLRTALLLRFPGGRGTQGRWKFLGFSIDLFANPTRLKPEISTISHGLGHNRRSPRESVLALVEFVPFVLILITSMELGFGPSDRVPEFREIGLAV
ncbi:unnamed protein product, partial [Musa acuminata var. zebrina]